VRAQVLRGLRLEASAVRDIQWVENGPPWVGVLLGDAKAVLDIKPDYAALDGMAVGAVGPYPAGSECAFEVRAFTRSGVEDPVTGSLNAGLALWLMEAGLAPSRYVASQGTKLQRSGRVHVERIGTETWIGGSVCAVALGTITL
jgi:predicted PhzF superfamily epimerase YddE/YHI9